MARNVSGQPKWTIFGPLAVDSIEDIDRLVDMHARREPLDRVIMDPDVLEPHEVVIELVGQIDGFLRSLSPGHRDPDRLHRAWLLETGSHIDRHLRGRWGRSACDDRGQGRALPGQSP